MATTSTIATLDVDMQDTFRKLQRESEPIQIFGRKGCFSEAFENGSSRNSRDRMLQIVLACYGSTSAMTIGAVHLAGWNFRFTTKVDLVLWRTAVLVSITVFPSYLIIILAWRLMRGQDVPVYHILTEAPHLAFVAWLLYACCRLIILVEMFKCLLYLPTQAFVATGTNLPHFG